VAYLIAGNWKMFKTARETVAFCTQLRERLEGIANEIERSPARSRRPCCPSSA
jgi:triosephosphate isomerase